MERKDNDLLKKYFDLQKIDSQHATGLNALTSKVSSLYQYDNQMKSKLVNILAAENQNLTFPALNDCSGEINKNWYENFITIFTFNFTPTILKTMTYFRSY